MRPIIVGEVFSVETQKKVRIVVDHHHNQYSDIKAMPAQSSFDSVLSLAVIPFADLSPDGGEEYFGDGLADELLNVFAQVDEMKVAGRTSSFAFKGKDKDLREIGEILGVATILEGSIRKSGDCLRITVQLIKADDGFHVWS